MHKRYEYKRAEIPVIDSKINKQLIDKDTKKSAVIPKVSYPYLGCFQRIKKAISVETTVTLDPTNYKNYTVSFHRSTLSYDNYQKLGGVIKDRMRYLQKIHGKEILPSFSKKG